MYWRVSRARNTRWNASGVIRSPGKWGGAGLKILANENMSGAVVTALRSGGHDVLWVLTDFPSATDEVVLARAFAEQRLLITFDKDFGELVLARGLAASDGVILCRISQPSPAEAARRIAQTID